MAELAVVLPTYNEAENLAQVVGGLEGLGLDLQLLVVDDNSQDGTQEVARELAETFGNLTVIARPSRLGLGSALRRGLKEAMNEGASYVATMDADGSHDPRDLPRLLDVMRGGTVDLVQGSRYVDGGGVRNYALPRRLASRMVNLLYHWCAGSPRECTTNFRVFTRRAASLVVDRAKGKDFEFVPEAALLVLASGLKVCEAPILFTGRTRGRSKMGTKQALRGTASMFTASFQFRFGLGRFSRRRPAP